jgi:hypothetical protein
MADQTLRNPSPESRRLAAPARIGEWHPWGRDGPFADRALHGRRIGVLRCRIAVAFRHGRGSSNNANAMTLRKTQKLGPPMMPAMELLTGPRPNLFMSQPARLPPIAAN